MMILISVFVYGRTQTLGFRNDFTRDFSSFDKMQGLQSISNYGMQIYFFPSDYFPVGFLTSMTLSRHGEYAISSGTGHKDSSFVARNNIYRYYLGVVVTNPQPKKLLNPFLTLSYGIGIANTTAYLLERAHHNDEADFRTIDGNKFVHHRGGIYRVELGLKLNVLDRKKTPKKPTRERGYTSFFASVGLVGSPRLFVYSDASVIFEENIWDMNLGYYESYNEFANQINTSTNSYFNEKLFLGQFSFGLIFHFGL